MYAVYTFSDHDELVDISAVLCVSVCSIRRRARPACCRVRAGGDLVLITSIIGDGICRRHFTQYGRREGDRQINSLIRAQCNRQVGLRQHERAATGVHDGADCKLAAAGIDYLYGLTATAANGDIAEVPAVFTERKLGSSHHVEVLHGLLIFFNHHGVTHRCISVLTGGDGLSSGRYEGKTVSTVMVGCCVKHCIFHGDEHIRHGMSVLCNSSREAAHIVYHHEEPGIGSIR